LSAPHESGHRPAAYPAPPDRDAETVLSCIACGYDLRGLPFEGRCPECGTPVEVSRRRPLLRHADPRYVRTLVIGAGVCLLAVLIDAAMTAVIATWRAYRGPLSLPGVLALRGNVEWITAALHIVATFLITAREWRDEPRERFASVLLIVVVLWHAATLTFENFISLPRSTARLVWAGLLYTGIAVIVLEAAWYRRLAGRMPRRAVRTLLTVGMWGIPLVYLVWLIGIYVLLVRATGVGLGAEAGVRVATMSLTEVMRDALSVRLPDQAAIGMQLWRGLMIGACLISMWRALRHGRRLRGSARG
jgi:hypothetical protein